MSKKRSILDMIQDEEEFVEEGAGMSETKRQTYGITLRNIELLRVAAFQSKRNKQDIVNNAIESYILEHYPDAEKNI